MSKAPSPSCKAERDIFLEALERPTPEERAAFLDKACADEPALQTAVEALLRHHIEDNFLESPSIDASSAVKSAKGPSGTNVVGVVGERPGDRIGNYKLLQQIGEGGVGVVFMAEQEAPVQRRVALKVLKPGMDTKSVIARFEVERQALALMDHPNIAKVLDAGSTPAGRPYFVMELVRGIRITEYCDQNRLATRDRLALFIQVCHAIQHAHQKGIIHRDIKPSNILVTLHDGVPVPKVIDFGIAKATDQRLTDKTLFTEFQSFIGTPAYISPEQAEMSGLDIDTRTDIYSLGVLLYELLVGKTPFDAEELCSATLDGMRRTIREREPEKPSTRLRLLTQVEQTTTAQRQRVEPAKLSGLLQGDLDWIALKALEKDRARRYATANDLALDIRRYLDHEPIMARPPSAGYRFHKLVRRNKLLFAGIGATSAALIMGLVLTTWQFLEKSAAYRRAVNAELEQTRLRQEADAARWLTETQALLARGQAYAADMNLAQQALAANNLGRAQELLNRHRPEAIRARLGSTSDHVAAAIPAFSPDLRGWEWSYLWQQCQSDALFTLCQLSNEVAGLSLSHDGNWAAIGESGDNGISIWDLRARREIARFPGSGMGDRFAFSPVSSTLAFASKESPRGGDPSVVRHHVRLWDAMSRRYVGEFPLSGFCRALFFSADGTRLLTAGSDTEFTIWNVAQGSQLDHVVLPKSNDATGFAPLGSRIAVTDDLRLLAQATGDRTIRVIDLASRQVLWSAAAAEEFVTTLAFTSDGRKLATGAGFVESSIRLWNVATGREVAHLEGHRTYVRSLIFWPDGKTLASASGDQTIHLWDVASLEDSFPSKPPTRQEISSSQEKVGHWAAASRVRELRPHRTLRGHRLEVWCLALGPDNTTLASGSKDGTVCVWDTTTLRRDEVHVTLPEPVRAWSFLPDSRTIMSLNEQGDVIRWQGPDFQHSERVLEIGTNTANACFSDQGKFLAVVSPQGPLKIWDLERGELFREIDAGATSQIPLAFFERSNHLMTQDRFEGIFRIHDVATGRPMESWSTGATGRFWKSILSPNEHWLFTLNPDGRGRLLEMPTGRETELAIELEQINAAAFSPDKRWLAVVSTLGVAQIWDTSNAGKVATLQGFLQGMHAVAFSPDSQRLAIGSNGNEAIKIWDAQNLQELITLKGQGSIFNSVAFSPNGHHLASRNSQGILHIWSTPSLRDIALLEAKNL